MAEQDRRDTYQGISTAWDRSFEFIGSLLFFCGAGFLIDRWIDTTPLFTIVFAIFGFVGVFLRTYYRYAAEMDGAQAGKPWNKQQ
ncbi:MAG: AtpZ/AtpI family protein [Acidimicrobiia bacterium]|nr:AtpZ/AtpI family protein [Acidimicrobiia bacterium]